MTDGLGYGALIALIVFIAASVWLGTLAHRVVEKGSFMKGFFLGNRGLGAWAIALTATVQSGGSFVGYPGLVYTFGWIVALWIASYMVVPITAFGVLGKRYAQISRKTGAITVPDLFRERFDSSAVGLTASLIILFFMSMMMVAQFKAGAVIMKNTWPGNTHFAQEEISAEAENTTSSENEERDVAEEATEEWDYQYLIGLGVFATTVVGYTLIGGFLAAVWTDLFQSIMMFVGVALLFVLVMNASGGLEEATLQAVQQTGPGYVSGPGFSNDARQFFPLGMAFSFFFMWVFNGMGSPAGLVRLMASDSTKTLRRSIFLLSLYNFCIYIPLLMIAIAARSILPDLGDKGDEVMPRMAVFMTHDLMGGSFWAGLILAAPFGAVMATVSSYLIVIASGLVRDIYQRFINPNANVKRIKQLTTWTMIIVGLFAILTNIDPVQYLQALIVFSGSCGAAAFVVPGLMTAFWRRATAAGCLAAMTGGFSTVLALFITGWILAAGGYDPMIGQPTSFRAYYILDVEPVVWALLVSAIAGITVSKFTQPPPEERVSMLFDAD